MARPKGLTKRGNSYFFQARIPKQYLAHYPKPILREKLEAETLKEAELLTHERWASLHQEFQRIDTTGSRLKTAPTPQEAEQLIAKAIHLRLKADEELRASGIDDFMFNRFEGWTTEATEAERLAISRGQLTPHAIAIASDWLYGHGYGVDTESEGFRQFALKFIRSQQPATKAIQQRNSGELVETPPAPPKSEPTTTSTDAAGVPMLSKVVEYFLDKYPDKLKPMYRKHTATLPMFLQWLGDKPVTEIKQLDIEDFLSGLCKLPPRWSDACRQQGITPRELADIEHPVCIAKKTYDATYRASLRPFLKASQRTFGDTGFPRHLTVDGIEYAGVRVELDSKQRAMKPEELKRLFEGREYQAFAKSPEDAHKYWLPLVGLYTGARVNEVCQINPMADILKDEESDIWYFNLTTEGETAEGVRRTLKTKVSHRTIPIHPKLIELGFLKYVDKVRAAGSLLLFPSFDPINSKASGEAEKWFRTLLRDTGLRDETAGARLVGFHTFRHTIENWAYNHGLDIDTIVGHAGVVTAVKRGYQGSQWLSRKLDVLEQVVFDVEPPEVST